MTPSIPWTAVEEAIAKLCQLGAELPEKKVVWTGEYPPRANFPCITLSAPFVRRHGRDWRTTTKTPSGIVTKSTGQRTVVVQVQAFGAMGNDAESPRSMLETIIAKIEGFASFRAIVKAAGIGIGPVSDISSPTASEEFEPRAFMTIDVHVGAEVAEPGFIIERAEVTVLAKESGTGATLAESTAWVPSPGNVLEETLDDATVTGTGTVTGP